MSLAPRFMLGNLDFTEPPFATVFGADPGNPEWVAQVIDSMLEDGEVEASPRASNRTMTWPILIEESDLLAMAQAEATLMAECSKERNEFSIDPGDGYGPTTVFKTFRVTPQFLRDDDREWQGYHRWDLTWRALPFAYSKDEVVSDGIDSAPSPSTVTVDACSSTTGWTATSGTVTAVSGELKLAFTLAAAGGGLRAEPTFSTHLARAATVDMSTWPYVSIDAGYAVYSASSGGGLYPRLFADGVELARIASAPAAAPNRTTYTFVCSDASVSEFRVQPGGYVDFNEPSTTGTWVADLYIDNLIKTNAAPSTGSPRQKYRSVEVLGSCRTPAKLAVEHETSALGDVLVYTCAELDRGYTPDMRRWLTTPGLGLTADAAMVSGWRSSLTGSVYTFPVAPLPRGGYVLMAKLRRVSATGDVAITWNGGAGTGRRVVSFPTANAWQIETLGDLLLPSTDVPPNSALTETLTFGLFDSSVEVDEVWLFYVGEGAHLTQTSLGTGTPAVGGDSNRLWLDTASVARPFPAIWRGTLANRSDARFAGAVGTLWEVHQFAPPRVSVFTVTTNALDASVSLRYFPAWHTNAAL